MSEPSPKRPEPCLAVRLRVRSVRQATLGMSSGGGRPTDVRGTEFACTPDEYGRMRATVAGGRRRPFSRWTGTLIDLPQRPSGRIARRYSTTGEPS